MNGKRINSLLDTNPFHYKPYPQCECLDCPKNVQCTIGQSNIDDENGDRLATIHIQLTCRLSGKSIDFVKPIKWLIDTDKLEPKPNVDPSTGLYTSFVYKTPGDFEARFTTGLPSLSKATMDLVEEFSAEYSEEELQSEEVKNQFKLENKKLRASYGK